MNKNYLNFISFARGIQCGFNTNDIPLLGEESAQQVYDKALVGLCSAYDIEQDILNQYKNGEIDSWEAVEQLEDEIGYSYDNACKKIKSIQSTLILSGKIKPSSFDVNAPAYWIAPDGKILPVYKTHIKVIFECPEAFGYSLEELKAIYDQHEEEYGSEGDARYIIMENVVMNRGWVRIRSRPGGNYYLIELKEMRDKYRDFLWEWAYALVGANPSKVSSMVVISKFGKGEFDFGGTFQKLLNYELFSSFGMGSRILIPITDPYDFFNLRPVIQSRGIISNQKRKRSKYHGALVNNTFDDASTGVSTGVSGSSASTSSSIKTHPSIRFLVVNHILHPTRRHLIKSSVSGSMDTLLYQTYCAAVGEDSLINNIKHTGKNGRVELTFKSDSGHSTNVDLGGSLEVGYVVQQIDDGLGLFPEGTEVGDLINNDVIQDIVRGQAERDKGVDVVSSVLKSSLILSMARGSEQTVPDYVLNRFRFSGYDGWVGENKNVQDGNFFARYVEVGEGDCSEVLIVFFVFGRDSNKSSRESPDGDAYKFKALYIQKGNKRYAGRFSDKSLLEVERSVFKRSVDTVIKDLQLQEVYSINPWDILL